MINLIPPQGKKSVRREYILRVGSACSVLFGFLILVLTAAHIPTYLLVDVQIKTLDATTERELGREEAIKSAEDEVKTSSVVLGRLKAVSEKQLTTDDILSEITTHTSSAITFKTFVLHNTGKESQTIQVQGVARTREALAQFKTALESSEMFDRAEIPISDLAKDSDLPFAMTITLAKK